MLVRIMIIGILCILGFRFPFVVVNYRLNYNDKIIYDELRKPDTLIDIRKDQITHSDTISFLYLPDDLIADSFDVKLLKPYPF